MDDQVFVGSILPVRVEVGEPATPESEHLLIEHFFGINRENAPVVDLITAMCSTNRIEILQNEQGETRVMVDLIKPWRVEGGGE